LVLLRRLQEGVVAEEGKRRGLVTYPHDEPDISAVRELICNDYGPDYLPGEPRRFPETHDVLTPTTPFVTPRRKKRYLTGEMYQLYELICRRFFASQMTAAECRQTEVVIEGGPDRRYSFRTGYREILRRGFMHACQTGPDPADPAIPRQLTPFNQLDLVDIEAAPPESFQREHPKQTDLFERVERKGFRWMGIAGLIGLLRKGCVVAEGRRIVPTPRGLEIEIKAGERCPQLFDPNTIRRLERALSDLTEGKTTHRRVVELFSEILAPAGKISKKKQPPRDRCERCGRDLVVKKGKFGRFLACPGFPECTFTKSYTVNKRCPVKGCEGEIIERRSKGGKLFYGCSSYPSCKFSTWELPDEVECPFCGETLVRQVQRSTGATECSQCGRAVRTDSVKTETVT
jgi:DNA topoisomerase-1